MSTQPATASQPSARPAVRIGVGIDTSRYGHYAAFLAEQHQPAAGELQFSESAEGYAQLRHRLEQIARHHGSVSFTIRLDAAGQYADNLLHFLHQLRRHPETETPVIPNTEIAISCGDPQRNKNYRAALFGSRKTDPVEARAAARFALSERPPHTPVLTTELRNLRQVAARLQATVRQRTRAINQLHHLLALTFPELALHFKDISAGWILELVNRYPTAGLLAAATPSDLAAIPYLPQQHSARLLELARTSIASLASSTCAELVRDQVRQLRDSTARQKRLETLLTEAYRALPRPNHLATIPGIGAVTAAVLTAFIQDIDRFASPNQLVAYFGVLPIEIGSGVDRDGQPRASRRYVMSPRGNDLVRRYLWMAALSAVRCNPAVRALYRRVVPKHPDKKAIAIGHAMRKLLHLVFALWKTGQPFDPGHFPWEKPTPGIPDIPPADAETPADVGTDRDQAAGLEPAVEPAQEVVTAACEDSVATEEGVGEDSCIDFAHLKRQLSMARLFEHLGLAGRLRGSGPQRRCACPIHRADGRGRTFSVNLQENVFHCFDTRCNQPGDVIDLWAALHQMSLRAAALDLVRTFNLEPAPASRTEKRHG
jgi:transposase